MEPVIVAKLIHSEKGKNCLSLRASSSVSKQFLLTIWNDSVVLTNNLHDA